MKNKRGQQGGSAFQQVLGLVVIAVLVIVAIVLFVSLSTSFNQTESVTITNETISPPTTAGVTVLNASRCGFNNFAVSQALNGSIVIDSGNYSTDSDTGVIVNLTSEFVDNDWNVTYSYRWGTEACESSQVMIVQFGTYPILIGLVGTILFLGLIIGVLVVNFAGGGSRL